MQDSGFREKENRELTRDVDKKDEARKGTPRWPFIRRTSITVAIVVGANQTGFQNPPLFKGIGHRAES
jgi:hypothetical protein